MSNVIPLMRYKGKPSEYDFSNVDSEVFNHFHGTMKPIDGKIVIPDGIFCEMTVGDLGCVLSFNNISINLSPGVYNFTTMYTPFSTKTCIGDATIEYWFDTLITNIISYAELFNYSMVIGDKTLYVATGSCITRKPPALLINSHPDYHYENTDYLTGYLSASMDDLKNFQNDAGFKRLCDRFSTYINHSDPPCLDIYLHKDLLESLQKYVGDARISVSPCTKKTAIEGTEEKNFLIIKERCEKMIEGMSEWFEVQEEN